MPILWDAHRRRSKMRRNRKRWNKINQILFSLLWEGRIHRWRLHSRRDADDRRSSPQNQECELVSPQDGCLADPETRAVEEVAFGLLFVIIPSLSAWTKWRICIVSFMKLYIRCNSSRKRIEVMGTKKKVALIESMNPHWKDLYDEILS